MVDFRVATYNVLSSHLAEPSRFPECDPKHLHAPTRLQRVKAKLQEEVSAVVPVVCLQLGETDSYEGERVHRRLAL